MKRKSQNDTRKSTEDILRLELEHAGDDATCPIFRRMHGDATTDETNRYR